MYVFYDNTGKIIGGVGADSPNVELTYIPPNTTKLYFDDTQYPDLQTNLGKYMIDLTTLQPVARVFTAQEISDIKNAHCAMLQQQRDNTILAGFTSATTGHTYFYGVSDQMKLQGQTIMLLSDSTITSVDWLTADAGLVTHDRATWLAVMKDASTFENSQHTKFYNLTSQVDACTTVDQIEAIVWS